MEACQESSPALSGSQAAPAEGQHIDLTEDLGKQLEDIISTYQAAETPADPEDTEEATPIKEADVRKDQKLEKKMLKSLGVVFIWCCIYYKWAVFESTINSTLKPELEILCCCSGKDAMLLMQSLNKLDTPQQKLEATIKKHAELVSEDWWSKSK